MRLVTGIETAETVMGTEDTATVGETLVVAETGTVFGARVRGIAAVAEDGVVVVAVVAGTMKPVG